MILQIIKIFFDIPSKYTINISNNNKFPTAVQKHKELVLENGNYRSPNVGEIVSAWKLGVQ